MDVEVDGYAAIELDSWVSTIFISQYYIGWAYYLSQCSTDAYSGACLAYFVFASTAVLVFSLRCRNRGASWRCVPICGGGVFASHLARDVVVLGEDIRFNLLFS